MKPKEYALYLLKFRDRAEAEIRNRMNEKGYEDSEIEQTLSFLKGKNFVDDERFAKNYAKSKIKYGLKGKYKVRAKLLRLGVDEELVGRALSSVSDAELDESLRVLIEKYIRKRSFDLSEYKDREKLMRYLASRGFSYEKIKEIIDGYKQ